MADVSFVRLNRRLTGQIIADLNSGFSVSGMAVVPYPDAVKQPEQAAYARSALNRGVLEEASRAEYEEQQEVNQELSKAGFFSDAHKEDVLSYQEHLVVERQKEARARVEAKRAETEEPEETDFEALVERRKGLLEEQEERGLNTDDPEAQNAAALRRKTTKATKAPSAS